MAPGPCACHRPPSGAPNTPGHWIGQITSIARPPAPGATSIAMRAIAPPAMGNAATRIARRATRLAGQAKGGGGGGVAIASHATPARAAGPRHGANAAISASCICRVRPIRVAGQQLIKRERTRDRTLDAAKRRSEVENHAIVAVKAKTRVARLEDHPRASPQEPLGGTEVWHSLRWGGSSALSSMRHTHSDSDSRTGGSSTRPIITGAVGVSGMPQRATS